MSIFHSPRIGNDYANNMMATVQELSKRGMLACHAADLRRQEDDARAYQRCVMSALVWGEAGMPPFYKTFRAHADPSLVFGPEEWAQDLQICFERRSELAHLRSHDKRRWHSQAVHKVGSIGEWVPKPEYDDHQLMVPLHAISVGEQEYAVTVQDLAYRLDLFRQDNRRVPSIDIDASLLDESAIKEQTCDRHDYLITPRINREGETARETLARWQEKSAPFSPYNRGTVPMSAIETVMTCLGKWFQGQWSTLPLVTQSCASGGRTIVVQVTDKPAITVTSYEVLAEELLDREGFALAVKQMPE